MRSLDDAWALKAPTWSIALRLLQVPSTQGWIVAASGTCTQLSMNDDASSM